MPFNYPIPFLRYMLQVILACYKELEESVGLMNENGNGSTAYDIVKKYTEKHSTITQTVNDYCRRL